MPLLDVRNVSVEFARRDGRYRIIEGVSFAVEAGGSVGVVGESGSGKSLLLRAILGVLPDAASISSGEILFSGTDLTKMNGSTLASVRGRQIAIVHQDPMAALNPVSTVERQLLTVLKANLGLKGAAARSRARELLRAVEITDVERVLRAYPHELSGGLAQRVCIGIAISGRPRLLLADEPTTALDVTVQAQILRLLSDLRISLDMALVLVSHDMAVVAEACSSVAVMYAGSVVESGPTSALFARPRHPYTFGLLGSAPSVDPVGKAAALLAIPGGPPVFGNLPDGCSFEPRCPVSTAECRLERIPVTTPAPDRTVACLHADVVAAGGVVFENELSGTHAHATDGPI